MFIPASSEFVALCKSQVAVLTQTLGAALSAVYLTEELVEDVEPKLIPVVVYPEATVWKAEETSEFLPELQGEIKTIPRLLKAAPRLLPQHLSNDPEDSAESADWQENYLKQRQIVLPLIHEGVVMGLLVTARDDRAWNEQEKATIERIAGTLTLACLMDQRRVWVEDELTQSRRFQAQQRDRLDDLLHQFRNPVTAIRTFGKLLFKRLQPGDKNQEAAASIVGESDRLQELLQQFDACLDMQETPIILNASPLIDEASQQPATPGLSLLPSNAQMQEAISITAVLEPLLVSARAIATERNLTLITTLPEQLPLVQGNAKALREVFNNLLDNALKYTPPGGQIEIRAGVGQTEHSTMTAIAISDTGPGIPPQDLEHLFERHYRGVQAATAIPGSGLGLAIAKELIEQMQGQIEVFSPAQPVWAKHNFEAINRYQANLGKGTTFVVWLSSILRD
ncbi:MAG: ATP-binding protein [Coleofasciculaceae cyanobacterium]